jgi:hypothetical protein
LNDQKDVKNLFLKNHFWTNLFESNRIRLDLFWAICFETLVLTVTKVQSKHCQRNDWKCLDMLKDFTTSWLVCSAISIFTNLWCDKMFSRNDEKLMKWTYSSQVYFCKTKLHPVCALLLSAECMFRSVKQQLHFPSPCLLHQSVKITHEKSKNRFIERRNKRRICYHIDAVLFFSCTIMH